MSKHVCSHAIDTPWEAEYKRLGKSFQVRVLMGILGYEQHPAKVGSVYAKVPRVGLTNAAV